MSESDQYAVLGNPVAHSRSPRIHALFALQCEQSMQYRAICVEPGMFPAVVRDFMQRQGKGVNVTVPFKQEAFELADVLTERAQRAGAVNTLLWSNDGRLLGDNTDGTGLLRDLQRLQIALKNRRILLLGAGGAARGILSPLLQAEPTSLTVVNRNIDKAHQLQQEMADLGELQVATYEGV